MTRRKLYLRLLSLWSTLIPCSFFVAAIILLAVANVPLIELLRSPFFIALCGIWAIALVTSVILTLRWIDDFAQWSRTHQ